MRSRVIRVHRYVRKDFQTNPHVLFLFGDNDQRVGMGGQAAEARGEPNAIGIRTKKSPTMEEGDFFTDAEYTRNIEMIVEDLEPVIQHLEQGGMVVIPTDGLGTGFSQMAERCPKTLEFLNIMLDDLNKEAPDELDQVYPAERKFLLDALRALREATATVAEYYKTHLG